MRVFAAVIAMALLGAYYYMTKDMMPLASFAAVYTAYEVISRIERLEMLKIPLLFGLLYISISTGFEYMKYPVNGFVYLISAGFALSVPVIRHRSGFVAGIAGIFILAIAFLFIPDIHPVSQMRIPLAFSTILIAITTLLPAIYDRLEFIIDHRPFLVFIAFASSIYYTQVRKNLYPGFRSFGDWILLALILMYFLGKFRFEIGVEEVKSEKKEGFDEFARRAEREYVENGDPALLLSFLSYTLSRSGKSIEDLERLFRVFVGREKLPRYTFGFEREMILRRREARRVEKLRMIREMFEEIGGENER